MKEIISDIKKNWKELPNSVKFWNGLVLLGLIITGIINVDILMIVWGIMSILAFAGFFDSLGGDEKFIERNLWVLNAVLWVFQMWVNQPCSMP